jgi:hypothetical protein
VNQSSEPAPDDIRTTLVTTELVTAVIDSISDYDEDVQRAALNVIRKMAEYGQFGRRSKPFIRPNLLQTTLVPNW